VRLPARRTKKMKMRRMKHSEEANAPNVVPAVEPTNGKLKNYLWQKKN
jgi:hypothetical protein